MPVIGTFQAVKDGYAGTIRTLMLNGRVKILANDRKASEGAPDFRISLGQHRDRRRVAQDQAGHRPDLPARAPRRPAWPQPIWGVLIENSEDGVVRLIWRRDTRAEGSDHAG